MLTPTSMPAKDWAFLTNTTLLLLIFLKEKIFYKSRKTLSHWNENLAMVSRSKLLLKSKIMLLVILQTLLYLKMHQYQNNQHNLMMGQSILISLLLIVCLHWYRTGTAYRPGQGQVHEERLAKNCQACDRVISSGFVNACGTSWHPNCFTCKKCGTKLARAKYYEHNNAAYCERCILVINPKTTVKSTVS